VDINRITKAHVAIRDKRAELKKEFEASDKALKAKQEKLELVMLAHLRKDNVQSVKTENGTVYLQETMFPSCSDWEIFHAFIKENDAFDALERRVKKGFIQDFMDNHDGELPPGIRVHREHVARVRRS